MKRITFLIFFIFSFSLSYAQSWVWGKEGKPVIQCNPYQGSFGTVSSLASDLHHNVFEAGTFQDTIHYGAYELYTRTWMYCPTYLTGTDPFLVKYDSSGNILWAKQGICSGTGGGRANAIATDDSGNIYETGFFNDTISFGPYTLFYISRPRHAGGAYLVKYNSAGNVVWAKQCSKDVVPYSEGFGITNDGNKYLYFTGIFTDTLVFGTDTLKTGPRPYGANVFLVKFDLNGNVIWAKQSNVPAGYAYGLSVVSDKADNTYITGYFDDTVSFGSYKLTNRGFNTVATFIAKFDSGGNIQWAKQSSNSADTLGYSEGKSILVDKSGASYITGFFKKSMKFAPYTLYSDSADIFLVKYNASGNVVWAKQGSRLDSSNWYGLGLSSDTLNHIYLTADVFNIDYSHHYYEIAFGADTLKTTNTSFGCIITKFDTSGKALCGSFIPWAGYGGGPLVSSDPRGKYIYVGDAMGGGAGDTAFYGPDTLTYFGIPITARWQPCVLNYEGINQLSLSKSNVILYPNPNNSQFTISLQGITNKTKVEIYNMLGEKIYTTGLNTATTQIDMRNKASGVYLYRVITETGDLVSDGKFIVN